MADETEKSYTPIEVFQAVKDYWEINVTQLESQLMETDDWQEVRNISETFLQIANKNYGDDFPCEEMIINGGDQSCMRGTILDVYNDKSMIFATYNRFTTIAKILINLSEGGDVSRWNELADQYCVDCIDATKDDCIRDLHSAITETFGEGGIFDQAIELANKGEWRYVTKSY